MGYILIKLAGKRPWKVQYRTRKAGKFHVKDIREDDYFRIGLHSRMLDNEIRDRLKQLNSQAALKALQEKRGRIAERLHEEELVVNSYLPNSLLREFETNFLTIGKRSNWRAAKRLILIVKVDQSDWAFYASKWYRVFQEHHYSYSYVQKLLLLLNKWGQFVSYKQKSFFAPIPVPSGVDKQSIFASYEDEGKTKASDSITPDTLERIKSLIYLTSYNWLWLSIWLGLRPSEVDSLLKPSGPKTWRLENGVLWVYQTKLTGVMSRDRWKPIPLKYEEQLKCLTLINEGEFKRPLNKTLKKYCGGQTTCYAGRKGFVDLMLRKGNALEAISQWMGHKSLDMTWKKYKDKKIVLT